MIPEPSQKKVRVQCLIRGHHLMKANLKYQYLADLIGSKRQKDCPGSLRSYYDKNPDVPLDYQTWNHIETGRRLPKPEKAIEIADFLGIDYRDIIVAYMRDLFSETKVQPVLDPVGQSISSEDFLVMCEAREIDKGDVVANPTQIAFLMEFPRSLAVLSQNFVDDKVSLQEVSDNIGLNIDETRQLVQGLVNVDLIDFDEEENNIYQLYSGVRISAVRPTSIPANRSL